MPKDPVTAFRGPGRGRYSVEKLVADRHKDREDEARHKLNTAHQKRDVRPRS
jgi:hypothetical protein